MRHANVWHAARDLHVARTSHWPENVVMGANKAVPLVVLAGMHAVHLPDAERPKCLFAFDLAWPPWCHDKLDSTSQHFATDLLGESTTIRCEVQSCLLDWLRHVVPPTQPLLNASYQ